MKAAAFLLIATLLAYPAISATRDATGCGKDEVLAAINSASAGDTVNVPSGICTWSDGIDITKGLNLMGAGIDKTIIKASGGILLLQYNPSDYNLNAPFRLSGFTFDMGGTGSGIYVGTSESPYKPGPAQTKIRIDHNRWTNGDDLTAHAIWIFGAMYGVADHNVFDDIVYPMKGDPQLSGVNYGGQWSWNTWSLTFGKADDNFYFEDNNISLNPEPGTGQNILTDCQYSGRYAYRYNTITQSGDGQSLFDMHGNQGGGTTDVNAMWSCFGGELYGNHLNIGADGGKFLHARGGEALAFNNNFNGAGSASIDVTEQHADSEEPTTNPEPQHVHDSYYWNNRRNLNGPLISLGITNVIGGVPMQNQDFWTDITDAGAAGVFCGPPGARPTTCTVGQGYWATSQSCTDLIGMVGSQPATPISGTLYRCTAANTWTAFYTPLPYPHPLIPDSGMKAYHIRTDGSDTSCNGLSNAADSAVVRPNCAFRTVQKGVNSAQAGETVLAHAGDYSSTTLTSARSGSAGKMINIQSANSESVILGRVFLNHDYIKVAGFSMTSKEDLYQNGLIKLAGRYCEISGNYIYSSNPEDYQWSVGVLAPGSNNLVHNNTFDGKSGCPNSGRDRTTFFVPVNLQGSSNTISQNLFKDMVDVERVFEVNGAGHVISGNEVSDICWFDYNNVHLDVFQTFATGSDVPRNIIVEGNYIHDVDGQIGNIEALDGNCAAMSWVNRNNLFVDISMEFFIHCPMEFYNNLFIRCTQDNTASPIQAGYDGASVTVKNNAFIDCGVSGNNGWYAGNIAAADYNYVSTASYAAKSGFSESHGIKGGNPQFTNGYHIGPGSAFNDKGTTVTGFSSDKDGTTRPQGSAWDIGPYEYAVGYACIQGDIDCNGCIELPELNSFVDSWLNGGASMQNLMAAIARWKLGC
jgi:hypothetical protein